MKKTLLITLLIVIGLIGFTGCAEKQTDAEKFKEEYESLNGKSNDYFEYRDLSIKKNNPFVYATAEEIVKKIENKETFVVYFGAMECPWCRSVVEQAIDSANEYNIDVIYYVDIWDGFHNEILRDTYEVKDGKAVLKSEGTKAYSKLIKAFDNVLSDYTLKDEDGNAIEVGEKRIYAPNYIYVKNGKAISLVEGISENQDGYNGELTEEVKKDEKKNFDSFFKKTVSCSDAC